VWGSRYHPEIVEDQERDGGDLREVRLPRPGELGISELVDERVGLAIEDAMALLDDGEADGLGQVALAGARRAEEEAVLVLRDEAAGGEFEDEPAIHLLVELEVEGVERLADVPKAGLLEAAVEEPILTPEQLVADERGQEVDRGQRLGLRLEQARLEAGGHARAAELAEGALQFDEIHVGISSWVLWAMTSR